MSLICHLSSYPPSTSSSSSSSSSPPPATPSFHFRWPHLVSCLHFFPPHPFFFLFVSDSLCPLRIKMQHCVFKIRTLLPFMYQHLNFPSVFQSRLDVSCFYFLSFIFPSANLLIILFLSVNEYKKDEKRLPKDASLVVVTKVQIISALRQSVQTIANYSSLIID